MQSRCLHAASLLAGAPDPWALLPLLREVLGAEIPVDRLEVGHREARMGRVVRRFATADAPGVHEAPVVGGAIPGIAEAAIVRDLREITGGAELAAAGLHSVAIAPLVIGGRIQGVLLVGSRLEGAYREAHLPLVTAFAGLVGSAVSASAQAALHRALARIAHVLARGLELPEVFAEFAATFREILPWDRISVTTPPDADGNVEVVAAAGAGEETGRRFQLSEAERRARDPLRAEVARIPVPTLVQAELLREGIAVTLQVPLVFRGEEQGILILASREPFAYLEDEIPRAEEATALLAAHLGLSRGVRRLEASEARYRELYGELSATYRRLLRAEKLASAGQLAAGVAHEINNPAAVVMSNLSHLERSTSELRRLIGMYRAAIGAADRSAASRLAAEEAAADLPAIEAELDEVLSESRRSMRRIRDIVKTLMRFAGGQGIEKPVDLQGVVERAITMTQNEIRHRARLTRDFQPVPQIVADEGALEQVFTSILLNAAQSIPEGAADAHEIAVRVALDGRRLVVEIRDDGCGIPADVLPRIFDPFFTTKPVGQATGLGLTLAHDLVKNHDGEIELESEVGRGTTVRVFLPIERARAGAEAATPEASRPRILIVDDEKPILLAAERVLRSRYEVSSATSGEEALRRLAEGSPPDVILCDLMMPKMTGMDLYEEIARRFPALEARVLFFTGGAFTPRARAFAQKMEARILEKPFEGPEILERVAQHLEQRR
jgi:signal transduction histidine kinase/CheY-like chemotaxis protein